MLGRNAIDGGELVEDLREEQSPVGRKHASGTAARRLGWHRIWHGGGIKDGTIGMVCDQQNREECRHRHPR